jgi:hypothetical protein
MAPFHYLQSIFLLVAVVVATFQLLFSRNLQASLQRRLWLISGFAVFSASFGYAVVYPSVWQYWLGVVIGTLLISTAVLNRASVQAVGERLRPRFPHSSRS